MITLKQFAVQFIDWVDHSQSLEKKSRQYYRHGWNLLSTTRLSDEKLDRIKNRDCDTLLFPGGAANANTALRTLRRMFTHAQELELVKQAPKIRLRKEWPRSVAMTTEQAAQIAQRMSGNSKDALLILRGTGARPKEIFSLRWEFVAFDTYHIHNPYGKTRAARRAIPLLGCSLEILGRRHAEQGYPKEGWVFAAANSSSGHMMTIQKAFKKARKAAGFPSALVLYCARHGMGTDLSAVISLKAVMEILGHSDAKTALRYQHPDTKKIAAMLASAERVM